ncbi:MAG: hypothetical protein ACJAXB_000565 [Candidatus Endobugula sp.]|jgi:hypothetical protein
MLFFVIGLSMSQPFWAGLNIKIAHESKRFGKEFPTNCAINYSFEPQRGL